MAIERPSEFYRERTPRPLPSRLTMNRDLNGLEVSEKVITTTVADPYKTNLGFYDPAFVLPPSNPGPLGVQTHDLGEQTHLSSPKFMLGNGHPSNMPNIPVSSSSASDVNRPPGPPRHSNQQRQQHFPSRRSTVNQTSLQTPAVFYPSPSPRVQDNAQQPATRSLAPPPLYPVRSPQTYQTTASPYNQPNNYAGQYTMSPQPSVNLGPGPPSYPCSPAFYHGVLGAMDSSMMSQAPHINFRSMPPHSPVYQFQNQSSDGGSSQSPFSSRSSPYSLPLVNPSSPPGSPLTYQQTSGTPAGSQHPNSYGGHANQYQAIRYGSPSTPYSYSPQTFLPSSFQGQFAPSPYSQHYRPSSEESMAAWWYMPHGGPVPAYNDSMQMQYQHRYPSINYPLMSRPDMDPHYQHRPHPVPGATLDVLGKYVGQTNQHLPPSSSNVHYRASSSAGREGGSPASSSKADRSVASLPTKLQSDRERPLLRRPYHPNPPSHRSAWVMWVGNVPADTSHDEFWRFLHQPPVSSPSISTSGKMSSSQLGDTGITSIFLIARSNCAFVNCDSEEHLHAAIARFNGVPLRTHDSRCPRLVCRVRKPDDDLRAGVGGQRGIGMHMRWVQEQVRRTQETEDPTSSVSCSPIDAVGQFLRPTTSLSLSSDEDLGRSQVRFKSYGMKTQSSTGSYASTNSSVLSRYFPKRFFILKSLSQSDLDTSVEEGLWATQTHNEGILDQAYRTSQEVYLIFGVNKSGEFYGYARMVSRILQGEHRVSWAGQADCSPSPPVSSAQGRRQSVTVSEEHPLGGQKISAKGKERMSTYFSPTEHRMVEGSPLPLLPSQTTPGLGIDKGAVSLVPAVRPPTVTASGRTPRSAPAELGATRREVAPKEPITKFSLNEKARSPADEFALDRSAPIRALRDKKGTDESISGTTSSLQPVKEENNGGDGEEENEVKEKRLGNSEPDQGIVQPKEGEVHEAIWGEPFRVEWLCTERLPFYRTRHMRNPWNHDREVKVSRDGTELEPGIGQQLIDEWLALAHTASQGERSRNAGGSSRRATKSTPAIQPAVTSGGR